MGEDPLSIRREEAGRSNAIALANPVSKIVTPTGQC